MPKLNPIAVTAPTPEPVRIAVFASGSGSNAEVLIRHFAQSPLGRVVVVIGNKAEAGVVARAARLGVPFECISGRSTPADVAELLDILAEYAIDLIALAGYLRRVPPEVVAAYPRRMVNVHPALLPRHGGQGMYGERVHRAVLAAGDAESGVTLHWVDADYDTGPVIRQARVAVQPGWGPAELAQAIHTLEHSLYPEVLDKICADLQAQQASDGPTFGQ